MTPAEKALGLLNTASKRITPACGDSGQATDAIRLMDWSTAIREITSAINELQAAKSHLAPLAENRPRRDNII